MTAAEFERAYAARSGVTVEWLRQHGRVVVPCRCGSPDCEGWASVSQENAADYAPGGIYHDADATPERCNHGIPLTAVCPACPKPTTTGQAKGKPQYISIGPANESSYTPGYGVAMRGNWIWLRDPRTGMTTKHFIPESSP